MIFSTFFIYINIRNYIGVTTPLRETTSDDFRLAYWIDVIGMERWENDATAEDRLDNVTIKVWLKRFWVDILENNNLLLA